MRFIKYWIDNQRGKLSKARNGYMPKSDTYRYEIHMFNIYFRDIFLFDFVFLWMVMREFGLFIYQIWVMIDSGQKW